MKAIRFRTKIVGAFATVLVVIVAACGGGTTATPEPTAAPGATATPTSPPATPMPENRAPIADFTFEPDSVPSGDANRTIVTFTATASDPDGDPLTFEWVISSGTPPTATGQLVTATFPGAAPYRVTLTVSDGRGGTVTVQKTVPLG